MDLTERIDHTREVNTARVRIGERRLPLTRATVRGSNRQRRLLRRMLGAFVVGIGVIGCTDLPPTGEPSVGPRFDWGDPWNHDCHGGTCSAIDPNNQPAFGQEANRLLGMSDPLCNAIGSALSFMLVDGRMAIRQEGGVQISPTETMIGKYNTRYSDWDMEYPIMDTYDNWNVTYPEGGAWIASGSNAQMIETARHEAAHGLLNDIGDGFMHQIDDFTHQQTLTAEQAAYQCR